MIRLGLRLSLGSGPAGLIRMLLMSTGAAAGVLVILACLAGISVADAQEGRARARTPIYLEDHPGGSPRSALRMVEINDAIDGRALRRIALGGAGSASPRPPGLVRYPGPGEVVMSPALAELRYTDQRVASRFPQRVLGVVGRVGLVAPDELLAYVGVAPDDPDLRESGREVRGFGDELHYGEGHYPIDPEVYAPAPLLALAGMLFVLVPLGVFLATCARLSTSSRDRRIAALRLLGVTARQAALINAVETGAVAAGGATLGALLFAILSPLSQGWRAGRWQWYAGDIHLPAGWLLVVLAAIVGYAVLVGVLATRPARTRPLAVRRDAPAARPGGWRAVPLVAAVGAAVTAGYADSVHPVVRDVLLAGAAATAGLALPLVLPLVTYAVAGAATWPRRTPVWLRLAVARSRHAPGAAPRLVSTLAVALYVAGLGSLGGVVTANIEAVPTPAEWHHELSYQLVSRNQALPARLRAVPGIRVMEVDNVAAAGGGIHSMIMTADCADFTEMIRLADGERCTDGKRYRIDSALPGDLPGPPVGVRLITDDGWPVTVPAETLHAAQLRHGFSTAGGGVLITRQALGPGDRAPRHSAPILVAADRGAADRAARLVSAQTPAGVLSGDLGLRAGPDEDLLARLMTIGMVVGVLLGLGAFVVAVADRAIERRRENTTLAVVGVRPSVIVAREVGWAALPLLLGAAVSLGCLAVIAVDLALLFGRPVPSVLGRITSVAWLAGAVLLAGSLLIAVAAWITQRVRPEHLRRP